MRFIAALLSVLPLCALQNPDALLAAIRRKMRDNLARLPNYTCRLTMDRFIGPENAKHPRQIDTVHIEVGYVDGREMFAWPGQKFSGKNLEEMLPSGGAIGTGDFALHVKSLFGSNAATFHYVGPSTRDGREFLAFEFNVPQQKSRYMIMSGPRRQAIVGYHGEFQADAATMLLDRLNIVIDEIPPALHMRRAGSTLTYSVTPIGGADFLLPRGSELFLVDANGTESRNRTRFEQCHQYTGESVISFAEPGTTASEVPKVITQVQLPPGLRLEMVLKTTIDTHSAVGDPVSAIVSRNAVKSGDVIVPKGAKVTGRITRIAQRSTGRVTYQVLGLQMDSIEFAGHRADFTGTLDSLVLAVTQVTVAEHDPSDSRRANASPAGGESVVFLKTNLLHVPAGAHMYWRTLNSQSQ